MHAHVLTEYICALHTQACACALVEYIHTCAHRHQERTIHDFLVHRGKVQTCRGALHSLLCSVIWTNLISRTKIEYCVLAELPFSSCYHICIPGQEMLISLLPIPCARLVECSLNVRCTLGYGDFYVAFLYLIFLIIINVSG